MLYLILKNKNIKVYGYFIKLLTAKSLFCIFIKVIKMTNAQLYLPTVLPQWGIFAGVVLLTIGYVDKRELWTFIGWITLILAGLTSLYFNLFGGISALGESSVYHVHGVRAQRGAGPEYACSQVGRAGCGVLPATLGNNPRRPGLVRRDH